ncbi:hypothetical protein [Niallia circulans]|nr:hypothetical protein [Niallia circulans]
MAVNIEDPVIIDEKLIVMKGFTTGCNMQPFFVALQSVSWWFNPTIDLGQKTVISFSLVISHEDTHFVFLSINLIKIFLLNKGTLIKYGSSNYKIN